MSHAVQTESVCNVWLSWMRRGIWQAKAFTKKVFLIRRKPCGCGAFFLRVILKYLFLSWFGEFVI